MDIANDIKLRLPIEVLVGEYCQVHKKGRQLKCMCPFHNDTNPSMLISPEKGIAYCFACNSGGDIFSFYQKIEGVDFKQAIKDLAEKAGIEVPKDLVQTATVSKDEKERLYECLKAAADFYEVCFTKSELAIKYAVGRKLSTEVIRQFSLGFAPDSYSDTYEYLLKKGFSKSDIIKVGIAAEREGDGKLYDRFRNRLMFPVLNSQGNVIAFGGRTLGNDDAKYINSPEGILYNKSTTLYGYFYAKDAIRQSKTVIMVEGYFDFIATFTAGIKNVVAVSGTALTEQHIQLLKRTTDTVVLCLDQDEAGKKAAERAYLLCSEEGLHVRIASINGKDPDEAYTTNAEQFIQALTVQHVPYIEHIITLFNKKNTDNVDTKKEVVQTVLPLIKALKTSLERELYIEKLATLLKVSTSSLQDDLQRVGTPTNFKPIVHLPTLKNATSLFDRVDIALGTFLVLPEYIHLLSFVIEPPEPGFQQSLYFALKKYTPVSGNIIDVLDITPEEKERAAILAVYCDDLNVQAWSALMIEINIKKQCQIANQSILLKRNQVLSQQMKEAHKIGDTVALEKLTEQMKSDLAKLGEVTRISTSKK